MFDKKEEKKEDFEDIPHSQNLIFNELTRFVNYFVNLTVSFEQSHEVLLEACDKYQLGKQKSHTLMTELKSNQRNTAKMFNAMEMKIWSL